MELAVLTAALQRKPRVEAWQFLKDHGVKKIEVGAGGFPGNHHLDVANLLSDTGAREAYLEELDEYGLSICALAAHGNSFHPDEAIAEAHDIALRQAIKLAGLMDVPTVVGFSGLPGSGLEPSCPNWNTSPWPPEHLEENRRQLDEVLVPYWAEINALADECNVIIALEPHPNMWVHNPDTMLALRAASGERIGCNLDWSHLGWRRMTPEAVIALLGEAIFHVHGKDYRENQLAIAQNGVMSCKPFGDPDRPWEFCTVGYGHGAQFWGQFMLLLRNAGYNGVISIEHEDALMNGEEGLVKAIQFLDPLIIRQQPGEAYWAK